MLDLSTGRDFVWKMYKISSYKGYVFENVTDYAVSLEKKSGVVNNRKTTGEKYMSMRKSYNLSELISAVFSQLIINLITFT